MRGGKRDGADSILNIRLPSELMERLQKQKEKTGVPVSEFVRRAIERALDK